MSLKAAIWYQGEEDVGLGTVESWWRTSWYGCALPALIGDWRAALQQPSLPFVVQQLHAWIHGSNATGTSPGDFGLALFRQMQQQVADTVPGVALSVAFDGGDPASVMSPVGSPSYSPSGTVHPHCKYVPGRRLARAMQSLVYNAGPAPSLLYPAYSHAVATSTTVANGTATNITVAVFFRQGSTGSGLLLAPYDAASNSSHCPTERGVNATYCDWFAIQVNDAYPTGSWLNATVAVAEGGQSLLLSAVAPRGGLAAVATRNGFSDWPVTTAYTAEGAPVLTWMRHVASAW